MAPCPGGLQCLLEIVRRTHHNTIIRIRLRDASRLPSFLILSPQWFAYAHATLYAAVLATYGRHARISIEEEGPSRKPYPRIFMMQTVQVELAESW